MTVAQISAFRQTLNKVANYVWRWDGRMQSSAATTGLSAGKNLFALEITLYGCSGRNRFNSTTNEVLFLARVFVRNAMEVIL